MNNIFSNLGMHLLSCTKRFQYAGEITNWHTGLKATLGINALSMVVYVFYMTLLLTIESEGRTLSTKFCVCTTRCCTKKCPCKLKRIPCSLDCHLGKTCANNSSINLDFEETITVSAEKVKLPNLTLLFTNDQNILLKNMWLTDNIVFAAEQLLNQQHPYISGLQDPCLQKVRTFAIQGNKEFVQCLIVGGNHWITISSVGCNPGTINVYDSMNCNKLTSNLKGIVADLLHMTNKYKKMQYQISGNDCGLFAVAPACSICNGYDPSTL